MTDDRRDTSRSRPKPLVLVSNLLLMAGVLLLIAWPISGQSAFGVVGIALLVFAAIFALANSVARSRRRRAEKNK